MSLKKQFDYPAKRDPLSTGFTLIELLIVVLIIGILSAVALPMYQGVVDESRFSTLLPAAKSIKDAQESMRMSTGLYTDNMEDLDISMENGELNFTFDVHNNLADLNLLRITTPKLENVRLASYFDFNPMMAGHLHCEAKAGDKRANRLCGNILRGEELGDTDDGYTRYLLHDEVDKPTCDGLSRSWSSSKTKCYKDDPTRCDALGVNHIGDGQCGYKDDQNQTVGEEMKCDGSGYGGCNGSIIENGGLCEGNHQNSCQNSIINDGGVCLSTGQGHHGACAGSIINDGGVCIGLAQDGCAGSTVNTGGTCLAQGGATDYGSHFYICKNTILNGGKCVGNAYASCYGSVVNDGGACVGNVNGSCWSITVNDGGTCEANMSGSCVGVTYNGTGCCKGQYCPADAPKCAS